MKRLFVVVTVLAATLCIAPQLWAKTFYLKNGEQIEYQRYWQKEGRVYLQINRDTLVDFAADEVDLAKTVKAVKAAEKTGHRKYAARPHHKYHKNKAVKCEEKKLSPAAKTEADPPSARMRPGNLQATAPPALQKALAEVYGKYNRAAQAGDFAEVEKYMTASHREGSRKELAKVQSDKQELEMRRKNLREMAATSFTPVGGMVTADGKRATLSVKGKKISQGKERDGEGTVDLEKEGNEWKVKLEVWNMK